MMREPDVSFVQGRGGAPIKRSWRPGALKLCTFDAGQGPRLGIVRNQMVLDLLKVAPNLPPRMKDLLRAGPEMMQRLHGYEKSCTAKEYFHRLSAVRVLPPVLTPGRYLDFYSFEGHVKAARARRGLDVAPEWYDRPTYCNGNPYAMIGDRSEVDFPVG